MFTDSDCTIFHKHYDPATMQNDAVTAFYINECFWDDVARVSRISTGLESSDTGFIMIPGVEKFVKPKAWDALEDKTGYWTIGNQDKIVKGNIPLDTKFKDLEDLYDDVLNVVSVDTKLFGSLDMHHVEVGAK